MLTTKEQAQSLLNSISVGQDELTLINKLMTVSTDVIKEMVAIIKEENRSQYERDKAELEFYETCCKKILAIIDNHNLSESQIKILVNLFQELNYKREMGKDNQDKRTEKRKGESNNMVGAALVTIIAGLLLGIIINKNK